MQTASLLGLRGNALHGVWGNAPESPRQIRGCPPADQESLTCREAFFYLILLQITVRKRERMDFINETLEDVTSTGKTIPWKYMKIGSQMVAKALQATGHKKIARRVYKCADELEYRKSLENWNMTLIKARFCGLSLCPICQRRLAIKRYYNLKKAITYIEQEEASEYILMTLTVRNVTGEELRATVDGLLKSFTRFKKWKCIIDNFVGFYRTLEISYNNVNDTYHPHLHIMFLVKPGYFDQANKSYLTTEKLVQEWKKCLGVDYMPVCDLRKIKGEKGVLEVVKYVNKTSDVLKLPEEMRRKVIHYLYVSLYRKRLVAFGGRMKEVAKELKIELEEMKAEQKSDREENELHNLNLTGIKKDFKTGEIYEIEKYFWNRKDYLFDE